MFAKIKMELSHLTIKNRVQCFKIIIPWINDPEKNLSSSRFSFTKIFQSCISLYLKTEKITKFSYTLPERDQNENSIANWLKNTAFSSLENIEFSFLIHFFVLLLPLSFERCLFSPIQL